MRVPLKHPHIILLNISWRQLGYVRYINILTWLRGFQNKLQFSLYPNLFWKLRDKRNLKNLHFWPESLGAKLEYWYIERGLLVQIIREENIKHISCCHRFLCRKQSSLTSNNFVSFYKFTFHSPSWKFLPKTDTSIDMCLSTASNLYSLEEWPDFFAYICLEDLTQVRNKPVIHLLTAPCRNPSCHALGE